MSDDERVERYAEALIKADPERTGPLVITQHDAELASAAMEVADAEIEERDKAWDSLYIKILRQRDALVAQVARIEALTERWRAYGDIKDIVRDIEDALADPVRVLTADEVRAAGGADAIANLRADLAAGVVTPRRRSFATQWRQGIAVDIEETP